MLDFRVAEASTRVTGAASWRYWCADCRRRFSVRTDTILELSLERFRSRTDPATVQAWRRELEQLTAAAAAPHQDLDVGLVTVMDEENR